MPLRAEVVMMAHLDSGTGNIDFTYDGFGTPDAAIFFMGKPTASNTIHGSGGMSIGIWCEDGQGAIGWQGNTAAATSIQHRGISKTKCIYFPGNGAMDTEVSCSAITDGVRLNRVTNGSNRDGFIILLKGVTDADFWTGSNASGTHTVGFKPDLVMAMTTCNSGAFDGGPKTISNVSYGFAIDGAEKAISIRANHNSSNASCGMRMSSGKLLHQVDTSGNTDWYLDTSAFTSTGFTKTLTGTASDDIILVSLKFEDGGPVALANEYMPITTGWRETNVGMRPAVGLNVIGDTATTWGTTYNSGIYGHSILVIGDGGDLVGGVSESNDDGLTTTVVKSQSHCGGATWTKTLTDTGVNMDTADAGRMTADGWEWNYTTVGGTANLNFSLALGQSSDIYQGGNRVTSIKVGDTSVDAVYRGSTKLY